MIGTFWLSVTVLLIHLALLRMVVTFVLCSYGWVITSLFNVWSSRRAKIKGYSTQNDLFYYKCYCQKGKLQSIFSRDLERLQYKINNHQPWRCSWSTNSLNEKWHLEETVSRRSEPTILNTAKVTLCWWKLAKMRWKRFWHSMTKMKSYLGAGREALLRAFTGTDRAAVTAEKCDFNFESARRFRAVLQDVQRTYKDFYDSVAWG